jgi:hypothetical protein
MHLIQKIEHEFRVFKLQTIKSYFLIKRRILTSAFRIHIQQNADPLYICIYQLDSTYEHMLGYLNLRLLRKLIRL